MERLHDCGRHCTAERHPQRPAVTPRHVVWGRIAINCLNQDSQDDRINRIRSTSLIQSAPGRHRAMEIAPTRKRVSLNRRLLILDIRYSDKRKRGWADTYPTNSCGAHAPHYEKRRFNAINSRVFTLALLLGYGGAALGTAWAEPLIRCASCQRRRHRRLSVKTGFSTWPSATSRPSLGLRSRWLSITKEPVSSRYRFR